MAKSKTKYWFLEPHGDEENAFLFRELGDDKEIGWRKCSDEKKHYLFDCSDLDLLRSVLKTARRTGLRFTVWRQRTDESKTEPSPFHNGDKLRPKKKAKPDKETTQPTLF